MIKKFLKNIYSTATELNHKNIESLFEKNNNANFLDLWCDDWVKTHRFWGIIWTKDLSWLEIVDERLKIAIDSWIKGKKWDLNEKLDFEDNSFDVVHANQVIEHLWNIDNFASEIHRVLKPGWYAIISTENWSSWCNIFASIMWWQIFSLTNLSSKKAWIWNPFALHWGEDIELSSWTHKTIFNYRWLKEFFEAHWFKVEKIKWAWYFPLPSILGVFDVRHSHFITIKVKKN